MKYLQQNGLLLALMIMLYACGGTTEKPTSSIDESSTATKDLKKVPTPPIEEEIFPTKFYVMANSGLNMRESSDINSKILQKIPYGDLVNYMDAAITNSIVVEGLKGMMIKVKHEKFEGYVFDGFLAQVPPAKEEETDGEYIKRLKGMKLITEGGTYRKEGDGYTEGRDSLFLPIQDMQEAYLVASKMHRYLAGHKYPSASSKKEEVFDNKDKPEFVFTDQLTVHRDIDGKIIRIMHLNTNEIAGEELEIILEKDGIWIKTSFGVS